MIQTVLTTSPNEAAAFIRRGGLVAFPTETVYGLGADLFDEDAIARIFEAKQRPPDNPLISHIGSLEQITLVAGRVPPTAQKLIERFFPGPLTVVLQKTERVPPIATAGLDTIGVRMPAGALTQEFLAACGMPVAAPSANVSGRPSPTTWHAVREDLDGRIDCILQGEPTEIGLESTVVDCTSDVPVLLRKGAVSIEDLKWIVPEIRELDLDDHTEVRSPGLKHRHYSPRAAVFIFGREVGRPTTSSAAYIGLMDPDCVFELQKICSDVDEYARVLFEFFRECDRAHIARIYCQEVSEEGIGSALMDRIRRAAAR